MTEIITENAVLKYLVSPKIKDYADKVFMHIKPEYFEDDGLCRIFKAVLKYNLKTDKMPSKTVMKIACKNMKSVDQNRYDKMVSDIDSMYEEDATDADIDWLLEATEEWVKHRALHIAMLKSLEIFDGSAKGFGIVPEMMEDVLSINFDTEIGHDFIEDASKRHDYYIEPKNRIPFATEMMNKITNGGVMKKTLNMIIAPPHGGKSAKLVNLAAEYMESGLNVIYITMEMAEEEIAKRIDANLLNVDLDKVEKLSTEDYTAKINRLRKKVHGRLIIKEYPTGDATAKDFHALMKELKRVKKFKPDVVIIDYLNICSSFKYKDNSNSYGYIKSISEELRALAIKTNTVIWTATQTNRSGASGEIDAENVSESFGVNATVDLLLAIMRDEDNIKAGTMLFKQLKNRYRSKDSNSKFIMGFDYNKMRIYDVDVEYVDEDPAPEDLTKRFRSKTKASNISKVKNSNFKM